MTALESLLKFRDRTRNGGMPTGNNGDEPLLRAELYSGDQMEQHGKTLAGLHRLAQRPVTDRLLARLAENEIVLSEACNLLTAAVKANRRVTPAGEWLLDNFYLIEEQIRTAKRHLPKGYSRELPRLADGVSQGFPRVYDIALATISHGDGRVDPENLSRFVASYQTVTELKVGELWAIPIMLRLALIENLRRVGVRIAADMTERDLADTWADKMMEIAVNDPKSLILVVADMARSNPPMVSSFVSELARRLQGQSPALALGLTWIEQQLSESSLTIEQLVQAETQVQAADQVSISNSIGSLRFLGSMDWREFVEQQSVVERVLLEDPSGIYGRMDFSTRDEYRHVVEKMAKKTTLSEGDVARTALRLSVEAAAARTAQDRTAHVGFYLIDDGVQSLERRATVSHSLIDSARRIGRRFPLFFYLGSIFLITAALTASLIVEANELDLTDLTKCMVGAVSLVLASQLAVAMVNWLATLLIPSQQLPKMDLSAGIPAAARTLVVVPTMIATVENVNNLVEALEVRFLANRDAHLHFALLTDFLDAGAETTEQDDMLLLHTQSKIEDLNEKYKTESEDIFFLFHRPRLWNSHENVWMGYERKRGKLADLNAVLRGGPSDRFSLIVGDIGILSTVKYVITLDTDTQLPRDAAGKFVGTMEHPLNHPVYDDEKGRVTVGYGILQPRVDVSLLGTNRSRYAALHGNEPGIDPYTHTVSDVYQDIFGEGSFIGKGIYNVDAFERALKDRFPEHRILSHDLLEGCYARSGLLTDVQLYEEYPSSYSADVSRRHRWIRGDWQLAGWLLPNVAGADNRSERNPLSTLSLWKLFDNLRRSLVPSCLVLMLLFGWSILSPIWFWTAAALATIFVPPMIFSIAELLRKPSDIQLGQHIAATIQSARRHLVQSAFGLACLPHEAIYCTDAILRTLVRLTFTKKHLLAWNPSGDLHRSKRTDLLGMYLQMFSAPLVAVITTIYLVSVRPDALPIALPILLAWFCSPAIAWWFSLPLDRRPTELSSEQNQFLHKIARKTWAFFEMFVTAEENWLPPDNIQEHPVAGVAHRTSPTNMGLSLLANLTAYDFGYVQAGELIERTHNALSTMQTLERHRGHLYNWYDTQTLKPLPPRYVSTVDSGNLAGHLLTLNPGLLAIGDQDILRAQVFDGLKDTLGVLIDAHGGTSPPELANFAIALETGSSSIPTTLTDMHICLDQLTKSSAALLDSIGDRADGEVSAWTEALNRQCSAALSELIWLTPWTALPGLTFGVLPESDRIPTLNSLASLYDSAFAEVSELVDETGSSAGFKYNQSLLSLMFEASRRAKERIAAIEQLVSYAGELANMEYGFVFDKTRRLIAIGYNADERRLDSSSYDLLASEARLCNFVAIAQGQLPQESWFALGRLLTNVGGEPVLFSWSGSMFEYLMPLLVMPTYSNTLLDQTCKAAVKRQIEYGRQRNIPWGISESGYNAVDVHLNYQYRAFGVPGLGLNRGLAHDLVIAPYASALALMVAPEEACLNLQRLASEGFLGKYGFYEAIDFTPSRIPRGQEHAVVRSFMAHHQGMTFLSLAYLLLNQPMQKRFESDPSFQATALLLQERVPRTRAIHTQTAEISDLRKSTNGAEMSVRLFKRPDTPTPEVQLLSNGRYHVMVSNSGGGYSRWKDLAVTRWREDSTCDNWGSFCYIRDTATGEFWSSAHQPTLKVPDTYEAIFTEARAEFRRLDNDLDTHTEIVVSSEDDIELRRVRITNRSRTRRTIDLTSYSEVVLAEPAHDTLHPAFSNLFVQTEIIEQRQAILCNRRPRSVDEQVPWMLHLMAVHGAESNKMSYETDRLQFIGRGNSLINPQAMTGLADLSGSQGSVLDPIASIRCQITLAPEESATVNIVTGIAEDQASCLTLIEKYQDRRLADRVFDLAWTHSQVVLRQLNASEPDGQLYARLASSIIYANSSLRADASVLIKNQRGQSGLWGYAISGDLPIVLLQIRELANIELVRQLVQAHAYWRLKGLAVDLVIWNEDRAGYRQLIQDQILGLIAAGVEANLVDRPGGIFVRAAEQISSEDRVLLQSVARIIIKDNRGTLEEQVAQNTFKEVRVPRLVPSKAQQQELAQTMEKRTDLVAFNGLGGFTPDGREYVITTTSGNATPAPWVNVLANPSFGTVISESGLSYTWLENAHEFRLTPWNNDPVTDSAGEAFYLRDEESGQYWSPTPLPAKGVTPYVTRHGFGYSVFEHTESGITSELCVYVAIDAPIKLAALRIRNNSGRMRRLSATAYVEWVLGDLRPKTAMHVITEIDTRSGALFCRNPYSSEFPERVAFLDVDETTRSLTADRTEFVGRNGNLGSPAALSRLRLSGKVGAGLDPCGALQVPFELADGQEREIVFRLGIGQDATDASALVSRFRGSIARRETFETLCQYWKHTLGAVNVQTPDQSLNLLANGWLLYQTISCRLYARSGYYQSGGAFGFRDQLQDAMAVIHAEPQLLRKQLLLCASRQFVEGDVQHWWHPPSGRGVRTHCSDDYLWLPLATCRYVMMTGDTGVLDEQIQFLTGRPVNQQDDSYYDLPGLSKETASLYEHCKKAILRGWRFGVHGLPLIGCGDWNDGMNLVGQNGKGESVWLGFFLHEVLRRFTKLAHLVGDDLFAESCDSKAVHLRKNIEKSGWDGKWYRRAYFDDGTLLGSASNSECQIDSISQSWSVLSGAGSPERSLMAMNNVDDRLVRRDAKLIQLLDPPFDKSDLNPGYIKGYVPGVRENGGQYTHGAIWSAMAFAVLGDSQRAWELFSMINPVNHSDSPESIAKYKVEPYVIAADVYALAPHTGRGGWTWYTGSAGWMYRLIIESLLGIRLGVNQLTFAPCLPPDWQEFQIHYRYRETVYHITVIQSAKVTGDENVVVVVDGILQESKAISLMDDRRDHSVEVRFVPSRATS
jgi:cellobiose phosphorylase